MIAKNLELPYWPFYCEENIWHLCGHFCADSCEALADQTNLAARNKVLFISNVDHTVALWSQRLAPTPDLPVVWDYHVVFLAEKKPGWEVWDFDSALPLPCPAGTYLAKTFRSLGPSENEFVPRFRLLPSSEYRTLLATDRSHMIDDSGRFYQPPPPWPTIGQGSNLMRFVAMTEPFCGEVFDLPGLQRRLAEG